MVFKGNRGNVKKTGGGFFFFWRSLWRSFLSNMVYFLKQPLDNIMKKFVNDFIKGIPGGFLKGVYGVILEAMLERFMKA